MNNIDYDKLFDKLPKYERMPQNAKRITCTDADGNLFLFEAENGEAALIGSQIKTSTVRLPATVSDESGNVYKVISTKGFMGETTKLKHVILPEGLEALCDRTFSFCGTLLSIYIPASVKYMGHMLWNCSQFEYDLGGRIYYTGTSEQWQELINSKPERGLSDYTPYDTVVRFIDSMPEAVPQLEFHSYRDPDTDRDVSSVRCCEIGGEITIPESYENENGERKEITYVGIDAFAINGKVKKVTIPSTVDTLCTDAFYRCESLEEVVIEKSDKKLTVGIGAFCGCKNLKTIYAGRECEWLEHSLEETNAQIVPIP